MGEALTTEMEHNAKLEAELVQQEAKDARSAEVRGLWGKHRGSLLEKAKATKEAREQKRILEEQQKDLEILVADIENEEKKSVQKAKEAEKKLANELEYQKRVLEEQMEKEKGQHAAEIENEALKMQEHKLRTDREREN